MAEGNSKVGRAADDDATVSPSTSKDKTLDTNIKGENGHGVQNETASDIEASSGHEHHSSMISPGRSRSQSVVVLIDDEEVVGLVDEDEVDTSQETSTIQRPEAVGNDEILQHTVAKETSFSNQGSFGRSRKRRRRVVIAEDAQDRPLLPPNQYETLLRRRAICKPDDSGELKSDSPASSVRSGFSAKTPVDEGESDDDVIVGYDEEYGDTSAGMKLNIIGGKVIVQRVNTLSDGRASPAQLTGLIHRGDVLLSIDNVSLVNLPLEQLMTGLKPLSEPYRGNSYKRSLRLRFAAGEGLKLLEKNETDNTQSADPSFALSQYITFVDQLSGMPMFEADVPVPDSPAEPVIATPVKMMEPTSASTQNMTMDEIISVDIADYRKSELQKYRSDFFMGNYEFSEILRASAMLLSHEFPDGCVPMTFSEMMESGVRGIIGAKALFLSMEDVDKGTDNRSFKKWNSTLSLRSRASARRRYVMKNVIDHETPLVEAEELSDIDESIGSSTSGDDDEPNGDELLLQLAAHDEIWRRNVVEVLRNAAKEIEMNDEKQKKEAEENDPSVGSNGAPQSLESLLFGAKVSNMLTTKKKSHSLPPEDVTSVLFDLMTNLTVTPDEISLNGSLHHVRLKSTALVPFRERHVRGNENALLAAHFLINDALPAWLKSFRPLPWEQRRILWPKIRSISGTSLASASYNPSDDGLTLDSMSTGFTSSGGPKHRKDLRQQIEDLELNAETRAETCFLITFYFTQELLPSIGVSDSDNEDSFVQVDKAIKFVKAYGAYLTLHLSLVCAAMVKAHTVIDELLALAKYDPRHREVLKDLSKASSLVLYDSTMLSAILSRIQGIRNEPKSKRRQDMMNICVLAYPDLRPWQVRQACLGENFTSSHSTTSDLEFHKMYYEYLSLLLHPWEGHDAARQDAELVTEWCRLSLEDLSTDNNEEDQARRKQRRSNFQQVASRSSSDHRYYNRDLFSLMNLSIQDKDYDLALDIVDEMLDSKKYTSDKTIISETLDILRKLAENALSLHDTSSMNESILQKVLRLLEKMALITSSDIYGSVNVSAELFSFVKSCQNSESGPSEAELLFLNLLVHQSTPVYALQTLARWAPDYPSSPYLMPLLHIVLQRGTQHGITREISGTLLRVRYARAQAQGTSSQSEDLHLTTSSVVENDKNVWRRMLDGNVTIEK
jgi:hypothetical protein